MNSVVLPMLCLLVLVSCSTVNRTIQAVDDESHGVEVKPTFVGNKSVESRALLAIVHKDLLALSRDPKNDAHIDAATEKLISFYRDQGFADVRVTRKVHESRIDSSIDLRFRIEEGPQVTVEDIRLEGNHSFTQAELFQLWRRRNSGALALGDPLFSRQRLLEFREAIRLRYQAAGYLMARVDEPIIERDRARNTVRVRISMREGPLYSIEKFEVDKRIQDALGPRLPPPPIHKPFGTPLVDGYHKTVVALLRDLGYHQPKTRVLIAAEEKKSRVQIRLEGDPGKVVRVGEIVIRGNKKIRNAEIQPHIELETGERFSGTLEDATLRSLMRTGLFRRARAVHTKLDDDSIRVAIEVEELARFRLETQIGYETYESIRGGLRYSERDFLSSGKDIDAGVKVWHRGWRADAGLTQPELLGSGIDLTLSGRIGRRRMPSFVDKFAGGALSASRQFSRELAGRFGYEFVSHDDSRTDTIDPGARLIEFQAAKLFVNLEHDTRDSKWSPRSGHLGNLRFDWADDGLGGDVTFSRASLDGTAFVPFSKSIRFVFDGHIGLLWPGEGSGSIPLQERFFAGGQASVRSFREAHLGPTDVHGEPIGGEYRNVFRAEARVLLRRPFEGAVFVDVGNVGRKVEDWGFSNLRYALGVGIGYAVPGGLPVRFDAAWNPDRVAGEREWVLQLLVGYPF